MRRFTVLSISILLAGVVATPAKAHPAAGTSTVDRCRAVEVTAGPDGFTAPASVAAGPHTFRLTTTDPEGTVLGLFRLHSGTTLDEFIPLLRTALAGVGQQRVEAGDIVSARSTLFGGINTVPGRPATFTQALEPGIYHLIDYNDILAGRTPVAVQELSVTGRRQACLPPLPTALIEMRGATAGGTRFDAPERIRAGRPILVRNRSGHVEEAVLMPIAPGVTAADVQSFFEAIDAGQFPPAYPFTGPPQGMPTIHSGRSAVIEPNLAPGRYALITWLLDRQARHRAAHGAVHVITVG